MIDLKNQLLMLMMIKAYDVSFYTLLFLISGFYLKDYSYIFYSLFNPKEFKETFKQSNDKINDLDIENDIASQGQEPVNHSSLDSKSSISIEIFLHKQNDTLAHSLLDYVTNKPNIQSISYSKNKFMLNHKNPILIESVDEVYVKLLSEKGSDEEISQVIEIYSYIFEFYKLRAFLKKIEYNYTLQIQNK